MQISEECLSLCPFIFVSTSALPLMTAIFYILITDFVICFLNIGQVELALNIHKLKFSPCLLSEIE